MTFILLIAIFVAVALIVGSGPTADERSRAVSTLIAIESGFADGSIADAEVLEIDDGGARERMLLGTCAVGRFRLICPLEYPPYRRHRWRIFLPDEVSASSFPARDPVAAWIGSLVASHTPEAQAPSKPAPKGGRMMTLLVLFVTSTAAALAWLLLFVHPARKARAAIVPVLKDFGDRLHAEAEPEGGRPQLVLRLREDDNGPHMVIARLGHVGMVIIRQDHPRRWWVKLSTRTQSKDASDRPPRFIRHMATFAFRPKDEVTVSAQRLMGWSDDGPPPASAAPGRPAPSPPAEPAA